VAGPADVLFKNTSALPKQCGLALGLLDASSSLSGARARRCRGRRAIDALKSPGTELRGELRARPCPYRLVARTGWGRSLLGEAGRRVCRRLLEHKGARTDEGMPARAQARRMRVLREEAVTG